MRDDRRCASVERCSWAEREDGSTKLLGALLADPTELVCEGCLDRLAGAVEQLPADMAALSDPSVLGAATGASAFRTRVTASLTYATPLRLGIDALRTRIDVELQTWAECLGMETLIAVRQQGRVEASVAYLLPRMRDWVLLGPQEVVSWSFGEPVRDVTGTRQTEWCDGLDGANRLARFHQGCRSALGRTRLVHRLTAPCPLCDHRSLEREDGSDHCACAHCGGIFPQAQYDWFCRVLASRPAGSLG